MGFSDESSQRKKRKSRPLPDGVVSMRDDMSGFCHTLFSYIPPDPNAHPGAGAFDWLKKKDYFTTNPEFFTMNKDGKRVVDQLCFSNHALRRELTKNVLENIRILKEQGNERPIVGISAMDNPGELCFCQGCQELKKKYQSPGGPLYDYLFELCPVVKEKHPGVLMQTLAYRLAQTQKPPVMPAGQAFPDNLIVMFCNLEANIEVAFNSPINRSSYDDFLGWAKLTPHLWAWHYSSRYAGYSLSALVHRLVTDLRILKQAGADGVFCDFQAGEVDHRLNFTELQRYLSVKLLQDIDSDVPALIRKFTDYQYGPAAPGVRTYMQELEEAEKVSSLNTSMNTGTSISRKLTCLTAVTIRRWQESFDRMEADAAADPRCLDNVRRLRYTLDFETLRQWNDLAKACPDYFKDYLVVKNRLSPLLRIETFKVRIEDWDMVIQTAGKEKPLPAQFDGIDKSLIRRMVPVRNTGYPTKIMDPDAAFGYAAVVNLPDKPFTFGFYQNDRATKDPGMLRKLPADSCAKWEKVGNGTLTLKRELNAKDIEPGLYRLYKLGEIQVTPNCIVWFSSRSWMTNLQLGERLYSPPTPDNDNRYDVHVSLKFDKPIPPTPEQLAFPDKYSLDTNAPYSVLCDQIIFVKKPVKP